MALQVVDGRERQLARGRERLGRREADEQRADQPGALRGGDQLDVVEPDRPRRSSARCDDRVDELEVVARGDLGHDAAEVLVHGLRGDHVGADAPVAVDHRRARVVAAGLQREDAHTGPGVGHVLERARRVAGVRHITSASSPLSW